MFSGGPTSHPDPAVNDPERLAADVLRRTGSRHLLLLLDFDGTLCEFNADPAAVRLPDARRDLLRRLATAATTGIVSGRRLDDVAGRAGLRPVVLAGMHGMEIEAYGERFVHPDLEKAQAAVREATGQLSRIAAPLPGTFVEEKGPSVVLHFRDADADAQRRAVEGFASVAEPHVESGQLRVMRGSYMLELLPQIDWNKGHAVGWITERVERLKGSCFVVYAGDDVTDQDAFAAIEGHGLGVAASDRVTANAALDGPPGVERFLRRLIELLEHR